MSASTINADQSSASRNDAPRPKLRRRFTQYGLRLLLLGMIVSACLFALWASWVQPYHRQQLAVDSLSDTNVLINAHKAEGPAIRRWLVGEDMFVQYDSLTAPADMPAIKFDALARLVFLRELKLDHSLVGDRQLTAVRHMPLLETLSVDHTSSGDDGLAACGGLPRLRSISLRYTRVTDAGLVRLETLPALEKIYLTGTDVTDTGITELARHRNLREVYVRYTDITDDGVAALTTVLPNCAVYY
jgi:hypothetical protein